MILVTKFILLWWILNIKKKINELVKVVASPPYTNDGEELSSFILDNTIASDCIQSYSSFKWFKNYEIVEAMGMEILGQ